MMCTRGPASGAEELPHHTQTKLLGPQQWWGLRHTLACNHAMQWDLRSTKHLPSVQTSNKMATTVKKLFTEKNIFHSNKMATTVKRLFTEKNILHQTSMHWHNERSILEERKKIKKKKRKKKDTNIRKERKKEKQGKKERMEKKKKKEKKREKKPLKNNPLMIKLSLDTLQE